LEQPARGAAGAAGVGAGAVEDDSGISGPYAMSRGCNIRYDQHNARYSGLPDIDGINMAVREHSPCPEPFLPPTLPPSLPPSWNGRKGVPYNSPVLSTFCVPFTSLTTLVYVHVCSHLFTPAHSCSRLFGVDLCPCCLLVASEADAAVRCDPGASTQDGSGRCSSLPPSLPLYFLHYLLCVPCVCRVCAVYMLHPPFSAAGCRVLRCCCAFQAMSPRYQRCW
jgi:hypothetical protein